MQALPAPAESLCIVEMKTTEGGVVVDTSSGREQQVGPSSTSFLNIGLQVNSLNFIFVLIKFILFSLKNGVLLRSVLDSVTGDMSDTRTRYIGSKPVKLFRILMQGNEAVCKTNLSKFE
jgi:splicing factor 3B subunit 3